MTADPRLGVDPAAMAVPGAVGAGEDAATALELSIVMPCLNEAETVGVCIAKATCFLRSHGIAGEVVIADNGSTDGSPEIATALGARVVHVDQRGYGSALLGGISAARGEYVIMGDADDSYDFSGLAPFVEQLRAGHDLVMGNRFRGGIRPKAMPWSHRYIGSPVLSGVGRLFFKCPSGDFHCGLRGFRRDAILSLGLRTTGMEFASEVVVKATLGGLRITEVPTVLSPDGRTRSPHLRSWRDGWRHLRFLMLYSPRWLFLYPGLLLLAVGSAAGLRLMIGPVTVGRVTFSVDTLLVAAAMVIVGFQAVLFAIFTKVFAVSEGFLPPDSRVARLSQAVNLEKGLAAGALLLVIGIIGVIIAIVHWGQVQFGPLPEPDMVRLLCPSVTAVVLGLQTILGSFFLSILWLRRT